MAYLTDYQYYENGGTAPTDLNWGSYQYVPLFDIVNNFLLMETGNHSLVNNEPRYKVLFHAKRAIQELNYDAFKEIKTLELTVCDDLRFILPPDYVNWVRISLYKNQTLYPMVENMQINSSGAYLQDNNCNILFDEDGYVIHPENSQVTLDRLNGVQKTPYLNSPDSPYYGRLGWNYDGCWYFDYPIGGVYGLNTETANVNPTFRIDPKGGVINFSSEVANESVVLEYVTDGMEYGDDSKVTVNKLFEKYIYLYIKYAILNSKFGVQEYIVNRARKDQAVALRNAKIRMKNIHAGRLLMSLRGQSKWIK